MGSIPVILLLVARTSPWQTIIKDDNTIQLDMRKMKQAPPNNIKDGI
jgi:hypothetical protein